jgi:hypothetical protein
MTRTSQLLALLALHHLFDRPILRCGDLRDRSHAVPKMMAETSKETGGTATKTNAGGFDTSGRRTATL